MADDGILPFDGGDVPHDSVLADRLGAYYRTTPAPPPDAAAVCARRVLARAQAQPVATSRARQWQYVTAAAVAVAMVAAYALQPGRPTSERSGQIPVATARSVDHGDSIQFELRLPKGAARVSVVGDFNGWDTSATPMAQGRDKQAWSAKIALLPGRHVYAYVVNGERWLVDPLAPQVSDDGYGAANALVVEGGTR